MIAHLKGTLLRKQPPMLVLDVHGVGYEMEAPMTTFYDLPEVGAETSVYAHMVVREDAQLLYAFSNTQQRDLFRNLLKVNGVGSRVALAILSGLSAQDFVSCINNSDVAVLTRVPGIGKKTAERLIIEMRDRLEAWASTSSVESLTATAQPSAVQDAISALVALGYKPADASRVVRGLDTSLVREELIRLALQNLSGGKR